ncbi:MAG: hypothetical protein ACFFDN_19370 [Candidatus Hodarchaeota archaeon]
MTKEIINYNNSEKANKVKDQLEFEFKMTKSFCEAARRCSTNYKLFHHQKNQNPIPFLDFDVIYGSIQPFVINQIVNEIINNNFSFIFNINGPHTLRYLLPKMKNYCLPPGSKIEILNRKHILTNKLTNKGRNLINTLKEAKNSPDPIGYIIKRYPSYKIDELIENELNQITIYFERIEFLSSILHNSIPIEEFIGKASIEYNKAYNITYSVLERERPRREINNINDALNVAMIVLIYNNPTFIDNKIPVPILISQTSKVLDLNNVIRSELIYQFKTDFQLLNNSHYLFISQLLANETDNRFKLIAEQADNLAIEAEGLNESYDKLIEAINTNKIKFDDLEATEWGFLQLNYNQFNANWGWLFEHLKQTLIQDRISYLNSFYSDDINFLLSSFIKGKPDEIKDTIDKTLSILHNSLKVTPDIESLLFENASLAISSTHEYDVILWLFSISFINTFEDDGTLFLDVFSQNEFNKNNFNQKDLYNGIRIFIHSKFFMSKGALFSVDFKMTEKPSKYEIGISWPHISSSNFIFSSYLNILRKLLKQDAKSGSFLLKTFYDNGQEITKELSLKDISHNTFKLNSEESYADYFEIIGDNISCFADLAPFKGIEMQTGLIIHDFLSFDLLFVTISSLISSTSRFQNITPINPMYPKIFEYIFNQLEISTKGKLYANI